MISIRTMTADDIPLGMRLKDVAGWNQTEADWERHLKLQPDGCFVASLDDTPAATLAVTIFGADAPLPGTRPTAWIAMVLTDPAFRKRGLANALLTHAIDYCEGRGVDEIRLDATAMGRPVYEKLGFSVTYDLTRWRGIARVVASSEATQPADASSHAVGLRAMTAEDLADDEVADLDRLATGEDRRRLLTALRDNLPDAALVATADPRELTAVLGFALARHGSRALQVGPIVARTEALGAALMREALARSPDTELVIDVPNDNVAATTVVRGAGLEPEREFHRMIRRAVPREATTDQGDSALWASAGPEFG